MITLEQYLSIAYVWMRNNPNFSIQELNETDNLNATPEEDQNNSQQVIEDNNSQFHNYV